MHYKFLPSCTAHPCKQRINDMEEVHLKLTGHSPQKGVEDDQSSAVLVRHHKNV